MDRLLKMDKEQFACRMQADIRRILDQVAEAVNNAPQGHVISGSEVRVRDLMAELRQTAFQTAAQMRMDATEASFSPSEGCPGEGQTEPACPFFRATPKKDHRDPDWRHEKRRCGLRLGSVARIFGPPPRRDPLALSGNGP